ncbi:MAG: TIGR00282 family metallophosphoesterase [Chloroflexi bacterium]|nr:TIGR00282 family metallophosphoesterase [Chloroflexota bacterium]
MRVLMVGDVVGKPGRRAVRALVPALRQELGLDLVIANGENAAGGYGITPATTQELLESGVDVLTSGNHIWDQKEIIPCLDQEVPLLRPLNYPPGTPGRGFLRLGDVLIINLMGRVFMQPLEHPFRAVDQFLQGLAERPPVIIVDFHAEATSEKQAMGWYLDGRASAVLGTHIHVPTADARILPGGTAFVTDVGMVGPRDSVIGDTVESVLERFLTLRPNRLQVAEGPVRFCAVLIDVDRASGRALAIERVDRELE